MVALAALPAGASDAKLTNEQIVRMTASEFPESEILRVIRETDQVAFDLDPDVIAEMRLAGVTAAVIKAMQERAAKPSAIATRETARPEDGTIEVVFRQDDSAEAKKHPGLPFGRVALFLICVDPTHVPDHWTTMTPLSQKFPRHHLVWFHEPPLIAADPARAKRDRRLPLPAPARVTLPAGGHPIEAGIAVWAPDQTWIPVAVASRTLEIEAGRTMRLVILVTVRKPPAKEPIKVEIVEPAAAVEPSADKPPAP